MDVSFIRRLPASGTLRKLNVIVLLGLCAFTGTEAKRSVYEFTESEGFSDGDIANHPAWLSNRPANNVEVTDGGSVRLSADVGWVNSICAAGQAPENGQFAASIEFSFKALGPEGKGDLISLLAHDSSSAGLPGFRVALRRHDDVYWLFYHSAGGTRLASPPALKPALGLTGQVGDDSDTLTISMTMTRGDDPASWDVTTVLSNATRSVEILSFSKKAVSMSSAFYTAPKLYFGFSSSLGDDDIGAGERTITRFTATGGADSDNAPADRTLDVPVGSLTNKSTPSRGGLSTSPDSTFPSAETVSLFKIPGVLKKLADSGSVIADELKILPTLNDSLQFEAYGFHGGYLPILDALPEEPRWTLDFTFAHYISLSKIILVPAVDHRFGRVKSYGFPSRFRVLSIAPDGRASVIQEWMDRDCPDPGRFPVIIDVPPPGTRMVRVEVYRGYQDGVNELFALDELYGIMEGTDHLCHEVAVSSEYESLPYWGKKFLIDQKTSLGLPLGMKEKEGEERPESDFAVVFDNTNQDSGVIELDLGKNRQLGWVTVFPAQSPAGIKIPGYGFPGDIAMEVVAETASGGRDVTRRVPWDWKNNQPGNNVIHLAGADLSGRWIRLHVSNFPQHNGKPTFALGELHVYNANETYAVQNVRLEGFPQGAETGAQKMINGKAGGYPVLFLLDWLHQIERRNHLSNEQEEIAEVIRGLELRWNRFWKATGLVFVIVLVVAALCVAVVSVLQRHKSLKKLKWRITRDLHDEVGSSLGSISLTALHLENSISDPEVREDLEDLSLMALEACASLKEVVWLIDEDVILLPALIQKLSERASHVLRDIDVSIEIDEGIPAVPVSLVFKRHLIMLFKEVIHNCARHSKASRVCIAFSIVSNELRLSVQDNGCGFDLAQESGGWGLESMKERASEIGGTMQLESAVNKGTTIKLSVPLEKLSKEPIEAYSTSN